MDRKPLRLAILEGERVLTAAGIPSARAEAEMLAAHLLGVERTKLMMFPLVDQSAVDSLERLVQQRATRVPLQHLTGAAALGRVTLAVGPGVFVPRPETEQLLEWGLNRLRGLRNPVVVDLCAGAGGLALALAHERPDAEVLAVDNDPTALSWARDNAERRRLAGDVPVHVLEGDVTDPGLLAERERGVDLLVCNPPYVPEGTPVPPEVGDHDPPAAVFAGRDGLRVLRHVVAHAARLLSPGGGIAVEHDDTHGGSVPALLAARSELTDVEAHNDLAGRPRFATARRDPAGDPTRNG
ncbi:MULTISPECIES: peptide chain release factor N(5)-glutamine methyltransferase [unclassified Actinopolyspora]|uniref:peptide chain release factor N(5)-glutamine methyltransferase n=1 Tax=unclassified Actinopolyspora TaxID=2639451 RepID=UPI0013F69E70|nr:peptide chain release factor N(5)-glutamine methyltransferase [Actinopolyspora sp. BKK2]NHE77945.1 peptide chain release factor N(5)-glutamine methyltransferase [Actinopolyspora sp. BKK1]